MPRPIAMDRPSLVTLIDRECGFGNTMLSLDDTAYWNDSDQLVVSHTALGTVDVCKAGAVMFREQPASSQPVPTAPATPSQPTAPSQPSTPTTPTQPYQPTKPKHAWRISP